MLESQSSPPRDGDRDGRGPGGWAVVAGASGGVGRAVALRLADDGYSVVVCGADGAGVEETRSLIEWSGGRAMGLAADLGDPVVVRGAIGEVGGLLGRAPVRVLVNNAGEVDYESAEDVFDVVFNLNVRVPLLLTGAFAPLMAARGAGAIVNVCARVGTSDDGQVQAAQAALVRLTRLWSVEYGPQGVRVNFVDPGDLLRPRRGGKEERHSGGADDPGEVAEVIRFLVSPQAAYVQGAVLTMHGAEAALIASRRP
ncbi:SDR family oxidoreductase [Nocardia colli]|uniref:SDR family oxidoreductase n=1 Tax=Nocardia colli TaxID=2545717 RepID=A0A5N0DUS5_9NOCA|nr:SDR family oxidoreductase [Nocardia colli]KAA8879704.1 SDR family oxidoreductase [Nocardia colli]